MKQQGTLKLWGMGIKYQEDGGEKYQGINY